MAELDEQVDDQIQDPVEDQNTAENTPEEGGAGSPPAQEEDWQAKAREYEAKLARQEERTRYLEQTNQLLERFNQQQRQQQPAHTEPALSAEQAELDKLLEPVLSRRMQNSLGSIGNQQAQLIDANDAMRFEWYLHRNSPEILSDEDQYNRVMQGVEQVRQQAAQVYGKYLSRVDAYLYLQGMEGVKEKGKTKSSRKQAQVTEEAKRQLQKQAAQSGVNSPEAKRVPTADIDSIRRRMMAGEKLTPDEKNKFRNYLSTAKF